MQCSESAGMFIPDPDFSHPESRIQQHNFVLPFSVTINFTKLKFILVLNRYRTLFESIENFKYFLPPKIFLSSRKYGFGDPDPGSGPDLGLKKPTDPGSRIRNTAFIF